MFTKPVSQKLENTINEVTVDSSTPVTHSISKLKKAGYKARPHSTSDNHVVVQDPVHSSVPGGKLIRTGTQPVIVHHKDVDKFISDRS